MKRCPNCGSIYPDTDKRCPSCDNDGTTPQKTVAVPSQKESNKMLIIGIALFILGCFTVPIGVIFILLGSILILVNIIDKFVKVNGNASNSHNNNILFRNNIYNVTSTAKYQTDVSEAKRRLKQLEESYNMVNKTVNVSTFFGRLNFCFDCILDLMTFTIKFAKNSTPEEQYNKFQNDLKNIVNEFITRSYNAEIQRCFNLKTDKAKQNRMEKYFDNMFSGFENSHSFWEGNHGCPHYNGPLYTQENIKYLEKLKSKDPYI